MFILVILLGALGRLVSAEVLFSQKPMTGTTYYDITNQYCNDVWGAGWAIGHNSQAQPYCAQGTLQDIGTNRIVAMNWTMIRADPNKWCGREVRITKPDGTEYKMTDGPFYIWDGCEACASLPKIDVSAQALVAMRGDCLNNFDGLGVEILDTYATSLPSEHYVPTIAPGQKTPWPRGQAAPWQTPGPYKPYPVYDGSDAVVTSGPGDGVVPGAGSVSSTAPVIPSAVVPPLNQPSPSSSTEVTVPSNPGGMFFVATSPNPINQNIPSVTSGSSGPNPVESSEHETGGCAYGDRQCSGGKSQICNHIADNTLAWVDLPGVCNNQ